LRLIESADETEQLALDCGAGGAEGVMFVPAFAGLFAPHWREDARGTLCGLTAFHERKHVVKAALDAAAFQAYEVGAKWLG
jgi:glycerol kinase